MRLPSLRAYSLVFIAQLLHTITANRQPISPRDEMLSYDVLVLCQRSSKVDRNSHPSYLKLTVWLTTQSPSECVRIRKMAEALSVRFQAHKLCLENALALIKRSLYAKQFFRFTSVFKTRTKCTRQRVSSAWVHHCDGSMIKRY